MNAAAPNLSDVVYYLYNSTGCIQNDWYVSGSLHVAGTADPEMSQLQSTLRCNQNPSPEFIVHGFNCITMGHARLSACEQHWARHTQMAWLQQTPAADSAEKRPHDIKTRFCGASYRSVVFLLKSVYIH